MYFHVVGTLKDMPNKSNSERFEIATKLWAFMVEMRKAGKTVSCGVFPGFTAGFGVWDVPSMDDLNKILSTCPAFFDCDWKINPLVTADMALEVCCHR